MLVKPVSGGKFYEQVLIVVLRIVQFWRYQVNIPSTVICLLSCNDTTFTSYLISW